MYAGPDHEIILIECSHQLTDADLRAEVIRRMNCALAINSPGLFRFVELLLDELERRGGLDSQFVMFRELAHEAATLDWKVQRW